MNDNGTDIFEGTLDALDGIAEGTGLNVKKAGELVDEEDANPTNEQELREQINAIREELVGRNQTHQKVAKLSNWSRIKLKNVIKQDGWIYEDEMIALVQAHTNAEIAKVLDRLEAQWGGTIDNTLGKPIKIKFVSLAAIQAERAKLKEVK